MFGWFASHARRQSKANFARRKLNGLTSVHGCKSRHLHQLNNFWGVFVESILLEKVVRLDGFFAVLRILSITYGRHLQQFSQAIHHGGFVFQHGVGVAVQGYGRIFVPQYLRQRSDVHAAFEGASGKGVSQ